MSKDSSFYRSVLLLTLLVRANAPLTSESIASMANVNAVTIRRLFNRLRRANLVKSTVGSKGGVVLARSPSTITLRDVFYAIGGNHIFGAKLGAGRRLCKEGYQFNETLTGILANSVSVLEDRLAKTTISAVLKKITSNHNADFGLNLPVSLSP